MTDFIFIHGVGNVLTSVTFDPPLKQAEATVSIGQLIQSLGTATLDFGES